MALRYLRINDVTEDLLYKEAATTEERGTATIDLAKALIKLFDSKIAFVVFLIINLLYGLVYRIYLLIFIFSLISFIISIKINNEKY